MIKQYYFFAALLPGFVLTSVEAHAGNIDSEEALARIIPPAPVEDVRDQLTPPQLLGNRPGSSLPIHYNYFAPLGEAGEPPHRLQGKIGVPDFAIKMRWPGADTSFSTTTFPGFDLHVIVHGEILLPLQREQLLGGNGGDWLITVSPGRIWREADDGDWSRGAFPFTLVAVSGLVPRYGVATFLFNDTSMSQIYVQISEETANWSQYDLWGQSSATYRSGPVEGAKQALDKYSAKLATRLTVLPWEELAAEFDDALESFDGDGNRHNISVSGLMIDDVFYLRPCRTRAGLYPFCRQMRHGVFSISKSLGAGIAMLWLAKKYGPEVFDEKITDYITIPADHDGWKNVTFGNALNMATGIGNIAPQRVDYYVEADSTPIANRVWYARSIREKLDAMAAFENYPWGPGEVFRYRSSDTTALSAAMDAYLRKQEGPDTDLWELLTREVFAPLGIDRLPVKRTIEDDGKPGTPMLDAGMLITFEEALKLARLLQDHGQFAGKQLLHPELTKSAVATDMDRGLPNGWTNRQGDKGHYDMSFWLSPQKSWSGCKLRTTGMAGYGGNYVIIMPNRTIGLRFADGHDDDPATWDSFGIRSISHKIRPFC